MQISNFNFSPQNPQILTKNSSDSSIDDEPFEDQDQEAGQNEQNSNQAQIDGKTLPMANGARSVKKSIKMNY